MPNNQEAVAFYCPSCGASIAMQGDQGTCAFCGTAIERPKKAQSQRPASPPQPGPAAWSSSSVTVVHAGRATPKRGSSCLGTLIMLLILGVVGIAVGVGVTGGRLISAISNNPVNIPAVINQIKLGPITKMAAVLPRDGKGGDLVVYVYGVGDSRYSVALIDGASQAPRWQSQPLSKDAYQGLLIVGEGMVYLTDRDQLLALRLSDGTLAWQAALAVEPQSGCEECLALAGGQVVVLEKNSGLQAFDAQTGKLSWSTRLADNTRRLPIVGDRLVITRESEDKQGTIISFLDAATGKPALQLDPRCPERNTFSEFERPRYDTPLLFSQDGQSMYTMYGFFAQCAQAFDLASGQPRWERTMEDGLVPSSWYYNTALVTEKALYVNQNQMIWALDSGDGSVRTLIEDQEYNLRPLALRDDTLIVLAAPTWDSQRQVLWGLDAASGERRWQQPLQAHSLRQGSSSGDWDWQLTSKGLVVVQVLRDEAQLIVETLDPRSGASSAKQETKLDDLTMPSLYQPMWTDDMVYLKLDSHIYAVDLATGKPAFQL
ncbi:MAG TPA: PQQ-binding-like beta-propeller repeat protein [Roseiflexaceae bacterium]|nr:PQQ-binding-like beta-propeller repeat protein [Roseiflexaceae bacterium]